MVAFKKNIQELISFLYSREQENEVFTSLWQRLEMFQRNHPNAQKSISSFAQLTEKDAILITYGDQFRELDRSPLKSLHSFLESHVKDVISGVHILPFYPYSSDDGFAVIDYQQVETKLGNWEDVTRLGETFRLMFDLVANHVSTDSPWFQSFLTGEEPFTEYFPVLDPATDLSGVVRPRATPVLTPVQTSRGKLYVWTTFSADQIDLDYRNPRVLLEMVDILLFYVAHGAEIIRLDAIAYLWKEPGTSCIHLPQTHAIVKLFRAILDAVAPYVLLITETNVPHEENISYFGDYLPDLQRSDEAQLVYQFPLAPLILHTFLTGDSARLTDWAAGLPELPLGTTFFNFTASHDGIGIRPAEGLLQAEEIQALLQSTLDHGGQISYRSNPYGGQSAYELNVTWYDALNDPARPEPDLDVRRFLASQAIMLSLAGVPGIYVHSLLGSRNCASCLAKTGRARSINREKFMLEELEQELSSRDNLKSQVLAGYRRLLQVRSRQPAFHPASSQKILKLDPGLFAITRTANNTDRLLCLINISDQTIGAKLNLSEHGLPENALWADQLTGYSFSTSHELSVDLAPYQCLWLKVQAS